MSDNLSITIAILCSSIGLFAMYTIIKIILELFQGKRRYKHYGLKGGIGFLLSLAVIALIAYCLYNAPNIIYRVNSWYTIEIAGPFSLITIATCLAGLVPILYILTLLTMYFPKDNEKPIFMVMCLSVIGGIGNSIIVFIINAAINRSDRLESGLYVYFILGVLLDITCTFITRKSLIEFTNNLVYEKRVEMIDKILRAPYEKLENVKREKVHAGLNNDTEVISNFINLMVTGVSSIITVTCCLIYIYLLNLYSFIFTVCAILAGCFIYLSVITSARRFMEQTREAQNVFIKFINDLLGGIKELYLSSSKCREFAVDIKDSCYVYRTTRIRGEVKFIFAAIASSILINIMLGLTAFLFPSMYNNIDMDTLRQYIVVFLFMIGPIISINSMIPNLTRIKVSWDRINELLETLTSIEKESSTKQFAVPAGNLEIGLIEIIYRYKSEDGEQFTVGPITCKFNSGEIVFVTGGNGSGKSTLAKIITGLYTPDQGELLINGRKFDSEEFGKNYYSTIFSDCYIFEKLYGINLEGKEILIDKYLKKLRIDDKLQINNGMFSTIKLSTGQKKRMALLLSYLEDKPICIFDEWAADQDPEFRKEFYEVLLPELKRKGKCVIAISHDDRYFGVADKVIKMEFGKMVDSWVNPPERQMLAT